MNEASDWIDDDQLASPAPRLELPRLHIVHLLMGMAATAAAFLPFRLQEESLARAEAAGAVRTVAPTALATTLNAIHGVCYGAVLFVATAAITWSLRGYEFRFEPGHYLAFEGTLRWFAYMATWMWLNVQDEFSAYSWFMLPQFAVSVVFFFWYLALAKRGGETLAWRAAYVVFALAPIVGFVVEHVVVGRFGGPLALLGHLCDAVLQGLAVVTGLLTDLRRRPPRHWSHWAVGASAVLLTAAVVAYYTWWMFNPPA